MPQLKNARHEEFCQQVVKGKSQTDAYIAAGYKPNQGNSSVLASRPEIKGRINEIKSIGAQEAASKVAFTIETALTEYEEARALAKAIEQPATMVSATTGKVKVSGIQPPDRVTVDGDITHREVADAREFVASSVARLAARSGEGKDTRRLN